MKRKLLYILALLSIGATGAWAQTALTPNGDKTEWTTSMPAYDIVMSAEYYTDLNDDTDNSSIYEAIGSSPADIWLGRSLVTGITEESPDGSYNTFAVPFNMDIPSGWTVKELSSSSLEGNTLTLNFADATSIEAGKPYLVKVTAAVANPTFDGVTVNSTINTTTTSVVNFVPTLGMTTIEDDHADNYLFLGANNTLFNPDFTVDNGNRMRGFRAYFQLTNVNPANVRSTLMDFGDGETTGIVSLSAAPSAKGDEGTYDLMGRRINGEPTVKGVYIKNGRKYIVK